MATTDILLNSVETLKYADLQHLAKLCGIKANLKAEKLRAALLEYKNTCSSTTDSQSPNKCQQANKNDEHEVHMKTLSTKEDAANDDTVALMNEETSGVLMNEQAAVSSESLEANNSVVDMDQETSAFDNSKDCSISDLEVTVRRSMTSRRSTYDLPDAEALPVETKPAVKQTCMAETSATSIRKPINWSAIHQRQFSKMDSLDVYLEKKQQRRRLLKTPPKRAAALSVSLMVPQQKSSQKATVTKHTSFVPTVFSTTNINTNFSTMYKTPSTKGNCRFQTATGTAPKSVDGKLLAKENRHNTPHETTANKSLLSTSIVSAKKPVFDLKASLSKPLTYTPHRGKLKPFSVAHVDVKQATKNRSRDQRLRHLKALRQAQRSDAVQKARRQ